MHDPSNSMKYIVKNHEYITFIANNSLLAFLSINTDRFVFREFIFIYIYLYMYYIQDVLLLKLIRDLIEFSYHFFLTAKTSHASSSQGILEKTCSHYSTITTNTI